MRKSILFSNYLFNLLSTIIYIIAFCSFSYGQESTISEELQRKVDEAKARKEIAEARKAELEATFQIPDADSLRTSTEFKEIKGEFIETRIQGYKAMSKVATEIACRSRGELGKDATLVAYRPEEAAMIQSYLSAIDKQKHLSQWYEELINEAKQLNQNSGDIKALDTSGGAFPPILGILGDVAALFQRKESYTPTLFDIADKELIAVFFDRFQNAKCPSHIAEGGAPRLFYPGLVPISVNSFNLGTSDLWGSVVRLESKRQEAESIIDPLVKLVDELNKNMPPSFDKERLNKFSQAVSKLNFKKKALGEFYKSFLKELGISLGEKKDGEKKEDGNQDKEKQTSTTQTTTVNVNVYNKEEEKKKSGGGGDFYSFLQAEKLYKLMNDPAHKGFWIQMNVTKAGGNVRVVSIPIVDIFAGNRVRFSGGAIVNYTVFDLNGQIQLSGIVPAYEEYTSSGEIEKSLRNQVNQKPAKKRGKSGGN